MRRLNYTKTHTHSTCTHHWLQCDERWVSTRGRGSAGAGTPNHASISSRSPLGMWVECVCACVCVNLTERGRELERQPSSHHKTKRCSLALFPNIPRGDYFLFIFLVISTRCSLCFYFSPLTPFLLPAFLSRRDCWRPEYICLATEASTSHQPGTNALPWEGKRQREEGMERRDGREQSPTVLWGGGLRALVVERVWQTLQDDTSLDSRSQHCSTICLCLLVWDVSHLCNIKQHSHGSERVVFLQFDSDGGFPPSDNENNISAQQKLKGTRDEESMMYSNKTHLRKSYYTVEYDNSYTLCWSGELVWVVYSQMSA